MRQAHDTLTIETRGRSLVPITDALASFLERQQASDGLVVAFIQHTSASLVVQENASPDVRADLERFFARLVPDGDPLFTHTDEGPDDMPAHVRAALTQTQLTIPVRQGRMALGTWQDVYVFEHRRAPQRRKVALTWLGT